MDTTQEFGFLCETKGNRNFFICFPSFIYPHSPHSCGLGGYEKPPSVQHMHQLRWDQNCDCAMIMVTISFAPLPKAFDILPYWLANDARRCQGSLSSKIAFGKRVVFSAGSAVLSSWFPFSFWLFSPANDLMLSSQNLSMYLRFDR